MVAWFSWLARLAPILLVSGLPCGISASSAVFVNEGPASRSLFCLLAASGFRTIGILAKFACTSHVNVVSLLAGRFVLASGILWLLVVATRQSIPSGRARAAGLGFGMIGFGVDNPAHHLARAH